jgi:acetyl esterase/lipase
MKLNNKFLLSIFIFLFVIVSLSFGSAIDDFCNSSSKYLNGSDCSYRGDRNFTASIDSSTQYYWLDMPDNFNSSETYPLIVYLHSYGGNRKTYSDFSLYEILRNLSREQGWIVVSPDYRLNSWMNSIARSDVTEIINEMKNDFNINSSRVHIYGESMGGGAALTYAKYNPTIITSVVSVMGVTNFTSFYDEISDKQILIDSLIDSFGGTPTEVPEIYEGNSVLGNEIYFENVPVKMFHGDEDEAILVNHSKNFNNSLFALGYSVDYIEVSGASHNSASVMTGHWQDVLDFFVNEENNQTNSTEEDSLFWFPPEEDIEKQGEIWAWEWPLIGTWDSTLKNNLSSEDIGKAAKIEFDNGEIIYRKISKFIGCGWWNGCWIDVLEDSNDDISEWTKGTIKIYKDYSETVPCPDKTIEKKGIFWIDAWPGLIGLWNAEINSSYENRIVKFDFDNGYSGCRKIKNFKSCGWWNGCWFSTYGSSYEGITQMKGNLSIYER